MFLYSTLLTSAIEEIWYETKQYATYADNVCNDIKRWYAIECNKEQETRAYKWEDDVSKRGNNIA